VTRTSHYLVAIAVLLAVAVGLQRWRDRGWTPYEPATPVMWLQAGPAIKRAALGFDSLIADIYWIRAVVYFGRQGLSKAPDKNYDLLYPMLDFVTTLDPRFSVAYRFGAIFLSEPPPNGPGRSDLAVKLLERGLVFSPQKWEYLHDIGFVHYWHERDFERGAAALERASLLPGAPLWLKATAAQMHSQQGNRDSARQLWTQIRDTSDSDRLRETAELRLLQFDTMDVMDRLDQVLARAQQMSGRVPANWQEVVALGLLRGIPTDATGVPFDIDPYFGRSKVADTSELWPMPEGFTPSPRR
jgi:hypothetical protein